MDSIQAWQELTKAQRDYDKRVSERPARAEREFSDIVRDMGKDMHNAACIDDGHYAKKSFAANGYDIKIFHGKE